MYLKIRFKEETLNYYMFSGTSCSVYSPSTIHLFPHFHPTLNVRILPAEVETLQSMGNDMFKT